MFPSNFVVLMSVDSDSSGDEFSLRAEGDPRRAEMDNRDERRRLVSSCPADRQARQYSSDEGPAGRRPLTRRMSGRPGDMYDRYPPLQRSGSGYYHRPEVGHYGDYY